MDKFTIVIPVYNEAKNLKVLIPKIYQELKNRKFEIIVVDDNSTDMTSKVLKKTTFPKPYISTFGGTPQISRKIRPSKSDCFLIKKPI